MSGTSSPADSVWEHISGSRWFGGKGRGGELRRLARSDWIVEPELVEGRLTGLGVAPEIATIVYPDGTAEYYLLLSAFAAEPDPASLVGESAAEFGGYRHDATRHPEAMQQVLMSLLDRHATHTWHPTLTDACDLDPTLPARVFTGQQSNTNVMFGDRAILKVFRRLEPGRNLDVDIHDALGRAGVTSVATLYGWVEGMVPIWDGPTDAASATPPAEIDADFAMLIQLLPDASDGWARAVDACAGGIDFTADAAALGTALADVHHALATSFPTSSVSGDDVADTMGRRLDEALAEAPELADLARALRAGFDHLRGRALPTQRVHGDFHLGQTLHTHDGWRIIDFEGEPMKSIDERRLPDSAWRDVAGMLRSFSYATSGHSDPSGKAAQTWLGHVRETFLTAYAQGLGHADADILAAYEADKAVYEVLYETRNRPDWLAIPLTAIQGYAKNAAETPTTSAHLDADTEN
ncbi:MAG TPA: phosphotransferase [Propionibacteriaceae bacterium]|nr:phosphotransferase [Propionibacteriaceae bacterium]